MDVSPERFPLVDTLNYRPKTPFPHAEYTEAIRTHRKTVTKSPSSFGIIADTDALLKDHASETERLRKAVEEKARELAAAQFEKELAADKAAWDQVEEYFSIQRNLILEGIHPVAAQVLANQAYDRGHSAGRGEVICELRSLVSDWRNALQTLTAPPPLCLLLLRGRTHTGEATETGFRGPVLREVSAVTTVYAGIVRVRFSSSAAARLAAEQTGWGFLDENTLQTGRLPGSDLLLCQEAGVGYDTYYADWTVCQETDELRAYKRHVTLWRKPTKAEIEFGYGAMHYKDFPRELTYKPDGTRRKWIRSEEDGRRYYIP